MDILKCPVCGSSLMLQSRTVKCENNHCYDLAKEGYVNLLSARKAGDSTGDNKEMARSRRDFLNMGYYAPLAEAVGKCVEKYSADGDAALDICCGEGYYTEMLTKKYNRQFYGFDLSKSMVRLAAKRQCGAAFFVANISNIPIKDNAVKIAFHLFAPFHAEEFGRILAKDGVIVTAIPGKEHLYGLKKVLYDKPYYNDEKEPNSGGLRLIEKIRVKSEIALDNKDDINALFQMTPYYYHTPSPGMKRLEAIEQLKTEIEFVLLVYGI